MTFKHPLGRYPIKALMNAIRDDLGAREPTDVARSERDAIQWYHGRRFLGSNVRRAPSYCWFVERINPAPPFKGDIGEYTAVATGAEVVVVSSWGLTEESAWSLRHNLVGAASERYQADCKYLGCIPQEPDDFQLGYAFETRLSLNVPIIGLQVAVATIEDVQNDAFITIGGVDIPATGD